MDIEIGSYVFLYISKILIMLSLALVAIAYKEKVLNQIREFRSTSSELPEFHSTTEIKQKAIMICAGVFLILLFFGIPFLLALFISSLGMLFLPKYLQISANEKMCKEFDDVLADSLQGVASSIEAGLTLQQALGVAVESSPPAFAIQAKRVVVEYKLGTDIDTALLNIIKRVPTSSTKMAIGALVIGRKLGGPLPTILKRISKIIRERARVEGRLRALTAQGRGQGVLVCTLPVLVIVGTAIFSPQKFEMLTTNIMGQILLITVFALEAVGIYVTLKTLKLDI